MLQANGKKVQRKFCQYKEEKAVLIYLLLMVNMKIKLMTVMLMMRAYVQKLWATNISVFQDFQAT